MKFDPDKPFRKIRKFAAAVTFEQNGQSFSAGGVQRGKVGKPLKTVEQAEKEPAKTKAQKREEVRARAAEKLADFREDESTDSVAQALNENAAAAAAEEANV